MSRSRPKAFIVTTLSALALGVLVSAEPISRQVVYHCATDEHPTCPPGYFCCGPITSGVGGTCMILEPGEGCAA
ncbi:hypothetical protein GYMLUDRAFT_35923 [Collybiopsis luxurians FD-317 M1]|nr:hypothetical protein GYMLUDRAFT_35923 [Collybiopsis luxurians FD-317 M1]